MMTITIDGKTQKFEEISADDAICLDLIQATPSMPRVIVNHLQARRNSMVIYNHADYLNREIVKQVTPTEFDNVSPFGTIEPLSAYVPTQKELKSMRKTTKKVRTAKAS